MLVANFANASAQGKPERDRDERQHQALANKQPLHRADLRSERQADANLTGPAADGVAHDSVESYRS